MKSVNNEACLCNVTIFTSSCVVLCLSQNSERITSSCFHWPAFWGFTFTLSNPYWLGISEIKLFKILQILALSEGVEEKYFAFSWWNPPFLRSEKVSFHPLSLKGKSLRFRLNPTFGILKTEENVHLSQNYAFGEKPMDQVNPCQRILLSAKGSETAHWNKTFMKTK